MSLAESPVIGTIRVQPSGAPPARGRDDSTLELVLESFAHYGELAEDEPAVRLIASTRLSRTSAHDLAAHSVRANLAQLLDDLQAEYDDVTLRMIR
jgi:hypothetical protein